MIHSKRLLSIAAVLGLIATNYGLIAQAAVPVGFEPQVIKDNIAIRKITKPVLAFTGKEERNGFNYYNLSVTNWQKFSPALFEAAPDLPPCGLNTSSARTWVDIYNAETNQRLYGFCAFSTPENLSKLWFAVPQGTVPPKSVYVVLHDRKTNQQYRSNSVSLESVALQEDCIPFNPKNIDVQLVGDRWTIVENGNHLMFSFGTDRNSALQSMRTIQQYGMNKSCFVGRPQPSFQYMLTNDASPVGAIAGEDCLSFNPATTMVSLVNNRWKIVDGNHWMFDFENNRAEAEQSLAVIQKYGFDKTCYVGRPNPNFSYLRR
jgi:hypothetical protein